MRRSRRGLQPRRHTLVRPPIPSGRHREFDGSSRRRPRSRDDSRSAPIRPCSTWPPARQRQGRRGGRGRCRGKRSSIASLPPQDMKMQVVLRYRRRKSLGAPSDGHRPPLRVALVLRLVMQGGRSTDLAAPSMCEMCGADDRPVALTAVAAFEPQRLRCWGGRGNARVRPLFGHRFRRTSRRGEPFPVSPAGFRSGPLRDDATRPASLPSVW